MSARTPAQVFPPGDFIREEMEARGWTQAELSEVMGRPRRLVNELLSGRKAITAETAHDLGEAFGTGPEIWMSLESAYRLSLVARESDEVARRAKAYRYAPIADMVRRNWIRPAETVADLEEELKQFFGVASLDDEPQLSFAARKSETYGVTTAEQRAWAFRVKHLGKAVHAARFDQATFEQGLAELRQFVTHEADARRVPRLLAEIGVRLVIVEHMPRSGMDGLTLWLDDDKPVVALSVRYDRIDNFWFTLRHELSHVEHHDLESIDENLVGEKFIPTSQKPESEQRADRESAEFLVPAQEIENFILRTRPLYSRTRVVQFANRIRVHPGIIVGQLHRRGEISYANLRDLLAKVRDMITQNALTDGWGCAPPLL